MIKQTRQKQTAPRRTPMSTRPPSLPSFTALGRRISTAFHALLRRDTQAGELLLPFILFAFLTAVSFWLSRHHIELTNTDLTAHPALVPVHVAPQFANAADDPPTTVA